MDQASLEAPAAQENSKEASLTNFIAYIATAGLVVLGVSLAAYWYHFHIQLRLPLSDEQQVWGQFGDYMGGILNPFVAICALLLLALGTQMQRKLLRKTNEHAERGRFATEWTALVTLLADIKQRESALKLVETAADGLLRLVRSHEADPSEARLDKPVARAIVDAMTVVRPVMTLIRSLVELIRSKQLPLTAAERSRYVDVVRSFLTDEDGIVVLTSIARGHLPEADRVLIDDQQLLLNMHGKTRARLEKYLQDLASFEARVSESR